MSKSKIGYHSAANCAGCNGINDYWKALDDAGIAFVAYSANDAGLLTAVPSAADIAKAQAKGQEPGWGAAHYKNALLVYRDVEASTVDPADYDDNPATMASVYWQVTEGRLPAEIKAIRSRCWIELLNEPGKEGDQANWVGWLMFYMAKEALRNGYRVMGAGWSAGTPEPYHWKTPGWRAYLELCAANPGKVAVSLHEYSLDNDIHHIEPWLIGRFTKLYDACHEMGIDVPDIFITECGWTLNSMPLDGQAKKDIDYLARLYAPYGEIKGANLWTLQGGKGNGNLPTRLNALMPWLTDYTIKTNLPDPLPEEPVAANLLFNPSFEKSWADATIFPGHIPEGWTVTYKYGPKYPNPYGGQSYVNGEAVKKHRGNLPAGEPELFIRDGDWTYKVFGGGTKAWWFEMRQTVYLAPGVYSLSVHTVPDHYHSKPGGGKDYNVDPNQAQVQIGGEDKPWASTPAGNKWVEVAHVFDWPGGDYEAIIGLRSNYAINSNTWIDNPVLVKVSDAPQPPTPGQHKAIVVKLPQGATVAEWHKATAYSVQYQHTMTASHDDMMTILHGGNAQSHVKVCWPERQQDVVAMIEAAGYTWEPLFAGEVAPPFPG